MRNRIWTLLAMCGALMLSANVWAQQPPLGAPLTLAQAKQAAAAAEAEAKKNNWAYAIAVVEPSGALVYFSKMEGTQYGSINVAIDKATSAALFRRPTAVFDAALRAGTQYLLQLRGGNAIPGGFPLVVDGKVVGGIGASGGTGDQDSQVATAGVNALK